MGDGMTMTYLLGKVHGKKVLLLLNYKLKKNLNPQCLLKYFNTALSYRIKSWIKPVDKLCEQLEYTQINNMNLSQINDHLLDIYLEYSACSPFNLS